jgi:hypothetical protein
MSGKRMLSVGRAGPRAAVRTHFEAWIAAWRAIGFAHAIGLLADHKALEQAHIDSLVYGMGYLRITARGGIERVHPSEVVCDLSVPDDVAQRDRLLRYSNLQARYPGPGLVEDLAKKWPP